MRTLTSSVLAAVLLLAPFAAAAPESLAADGRVGVVVERQGLVFVRPAGRQRWSPVGPRSVVLPGDRLRTETRGANALEVRLQAGGRLTLGPGVLLDVRPDGALHLLAGEAEVQGSAAAPLKVSGPGGFALDATDPAWLKAADGRVTRLDAAPSWLTGYRSNTTDEWMGALLATVGDQQVPLHVGYHKVDVEVRDQVARTTVEQSFVNDSDTRLEGVFRFPLPADASISGFGMWIGSEYVEADVVERERARQIYQDILRRKKDPGLLEWAGGNVFQARVFPIEPKSEKRVRLSYTEVLPLEGSTWRYRYALRSELTRKHPLRELQLTVRAASTLPLQQVACPTHADATVSAQAHTALVELSQRAVTPTRDFEVAGTVKGADGLTVVTHRRGDDGWFLLQVQPPQAGDDLWQRDLVPEGAPLEVLLAVDTSGSVDAAARGKGEAFVRALLGLLGPQDRVRVMTFDTRARWMSDSARAADPDLLDEALRFLAARPARGWTDLDGAVDALLRVAPAGAQVVVLTDGIGTAGDGDPVALAQRIRARAGSTRAVVHAVAPGSAYEKPVLEALASLGGGSVRNLREDPAGVAQRLLTEAALPLLKDLHVEVQGIPTARVYPEQLPNLPLGVQQTVLGRFLPTGAAAAGTVVVSGTLEGKPVRFTAPLTVPGDEEGNSFLPRLWARRHLDALLAQGDARAVKDEIVRFSTEYGILTPLTSLLVLESDEDREQYGVTRRVHIRDGEAEFAQARDAVALEALRQSVKEARAWRSGMRRRVLAGINRLGRDRGLDVGEVGLGEQLPVLRAAEGGLLTAGLSGILAAEGVEFRGLGAADEIGQFVDMSENGFMQLKGLAAPCAAPMACAAVPGELSGAAGQEESQDDGEEPEADVALPERYEVLEEQQTRAISGFGFTSFGQSVLRDADGDTYLTERIPPFQDPLGLPGDGATALGFPPRGRPQFVEPLPPEPPAADATVRALLERVLGPAALPPDLRLRARVVAEQVHPLRGSAQAAGTLDLLVDAARWFQRIAYPNAEPTERSLEQGVRTDLAAARRLARAWPAGPAARHDLPWLLRQLGLPEAAELEGAAVRQAADPGLPAGVVRLDVTRAPQTQSERWLVDAAQARVTERALLEHGRVRSRTLYLDPVEAGGRWWPTRIEERDDQDRVVARRRLLLDAPAAEAFDGLFAAALAGREDVLLLGPAAPTVPEARERLARGQAGFAERLALALERLERQRHDEAWVHAEAALALAVGKPGVLWVRAALLARTRRGEDLKRLVSGDLAALVLASPAQAYPLAQHLLSLAWNGALSSGEALALFERLTPLVLSSPSAVDAAWTWRWLRVVALTRADRAVEARALVAALAAERPGDLGAALAREASLADDGDPDAAAAWTARALAAGGPWSEAERDALESRLSDRLYGRRRLADLEPALRAWAQARPTSLYAWQRWVSSLYLLGREQEGDAWIVSALGTLGLGDELGDEDGARLGAALTLAEGNTWGWRSGALHPPLLEAACTWAVAGLGREDGRLEAATGYLGNWRVQQTEPARQARATARAQVLDPGLRRGMSTRRLSALLALSDWTTAGADEATITPLLEDLAERTRAAPTWEEQSALAELRVRLLDGRGLAERATEVWADLRAQATGRARAEATRGLLSRLLAQPWALASEARALALVADLGQEAPRPEGAAYAERVSRLQALLDWARAGRSQAHLGTPQEQKARSRAEARAREREARRTARAELAGVLAAFEAQSPPASGSLTPVRLERLALLAENGSELEAVVSGAAALRPALAAPGAPRDREDPWSRIADWEEGRATALLLYAATRRGASPAVIGAVEAAVRQPSGSEASDPRGNEARLLIALDRVEDLRARLKEWTAGPGAEARFLRLSAWLEAELGRLAPAAEALERLKTVEGGLSGRDYEVLGRWLLVLGEDARRRAALRARLENEDLGSLHRRLEAEAGRLAGGGPGAPSGLDPESLQAAEVLFEKAEQPEAFLPVLLQIYGQTKDHRVLAVLPGAVHGHPHGTLYRLLTALAQQIENVHEEASLEALRQAIEQQLAGARVALERRGLSLMLALSEARAAQVLLKDPRRSTRALAALKNVVGALEPGEVRWLADLLGQVRWAPAGALAEERLRHLEALARSADVPSGDRLMVVRVLAKVLAAEGRVDDALLRLDAGEQEALASGAPRAWAEIPQARDQRIALLTEKGRLGEVESVLRRAWEQAPSPQNREDLTQRIWGLYAQALNKGAALSLGRGEALLRAALGRIETHWARTPALADAASEAHAAVLLEGFRMGLSAAAQEARAFAGARLPALLAADPLASSRAAQRMAEVLVGVGAPREALRFLLDRAGQEPPFLRRLGADVWEQNRASLAGWRAQAEPLGDLEARLLAFVLEHLRELVGRDEEDVQGFWNAGEREHFWAAKVPDFEAAVLEQVEAAPASSVRPLVAARYLRGMDRLRSAVAVVEAAHQRGVLDQAGRRSLASLLTEAGRPADALAVVEALVGELPDDLALAAWKLRLLGQAGRAADAAPWLRASVERFAPADEPRYLGPLATLGEAAHDAGLHEAAVGLLTRAIALGQTMNAGVHGWRRPLARSLSALSRTAEAVEQAAILALAYPSDLRRDLEPELDDPDVLESVLAHTHDLAGYVRGYEAEVARTGEDAALIRRALVRVYRKAQPDPAALRHQLEVLSSLVPGDVPVLRLLLERYDADGERAKALSVAQGLVDAEPGEAALWQDLGRRFAEAGEAEEAERALTGAIEARPLEPDGPRMLAEERLRRGRAPEAALLWRRVTRARPLEPEGRLGEAKAWIAAGRPADARAPLDEILGGTWEQQFAPVREEAARLRGTLR